MKVIDKDLVVRSAVILASILVSTSQRIKVDVAKEVRESHKLLQRHNQLPHSVKTLFGSEHEFSSPRSNADKNVRKLFRRVRRSLNPDLRPGAAVVRPDAVIFFIGRSANVFIFLSLPNSDHLMNYLGGYNIVQLVTHNKQSNYNLPNDSKRI